jgi:hypothetical protein
MHSTSAESTHDHQEQINMVFANNIYPLTVYKIAQAQKDNEVLKKLSTHDKYSTQLVEGTQFLCKDGKTVIPTVLFTAEQLPGITTTCSILDTPVLKRRYMQQCIGKI